MSWKEKATLLKCDQYLAVQKTSTVLLTRDKAAGLCVTGDFKEGWQPLRSSVVMSGLQRKGRQTSCADLVLSEEANG